MRQVSARGAATGLALLALAAAPAGNAQSAGDEDLPTIRLSGAGVELLKLAIPRGEGDAESARAAADLLSKDMDITGLFQVLDPTSFPSSSS